MWECFSAISGKNSVDLGDSAAGGVIVDLDWEWLLRCHFSDYESVVKRSPHWEGWDQTSAVREVVLAGAVVDHSPGQPC